MCVNSETLFSITQSLVPNTSGSLQVSAKMC